MLKQNQKGFTLVELMVALAIGSTLLAAAVGIYVTTVINSGSVIASSRLNQEMATMMDVMIRDIRRAGYSGEPAVVGSPTSNSFQEPDVTALAIRTSTASATADVTTGSCILYSYDSDDDGVLDATDLLGFRLNSGVVQMRQNGVLANARHDTCEATTSGTWVDVTDASTISVTQLTFNSNATGAESTCLVVGADDGVDQNGDGDTGDEERDCMVSANIPASGSGEVTVDTRVITITLAGQLVGDASVSHSVQRSVRVRNDLVRVW